MFGEKVLIGYSSCNIDEKNRVYLPRFSGAEAGDRLLIIPEDENIAIYSSSTLDNYVEKISLLNDVNEKKEYLNEFRKYCENAIQEATVDKQKRITLSTNIDFIDKNIEIRGSGDRLLVSGNFTYPSLYRKRV